MSSPRRTLTPVAAGEVSFGRCLSSNVQVFFHTFFFEDTTASSCRLLLRFQMSKCRFGLPHVLSMLCAAVACPGRRFHFCKCGEMNPMQQITHSTLRNNNTAATKHTAAGTRPVRTCVLVGVRFGERRHERRHVCGTTVSCCTCHCASGASSHRLHRWSLHRKLRNVCQTKLVDVSHHVLRPPPPSVYVSHKYITKHQRRKHAL